VFGKSEGSRRTDPVQPEPVDSDRRLVEEAQRDPARFEALYRKYVAQIYSFAFYELANRPEAEDVTERTFMLALDGLPRFRERAAEGEPSTFRLWLFRIARNVIANHRRSARRHPVAPLEAASLVPAPFDVEGDVVRREEARSAWRLVRDLPANRRRVLVLRFVDELSSREIAEVLGISEGAVRVLVHRSLRSIASRMDARPKDSRPEGSLPRIARSQEKRSQEKRS
jgi:RNA polymerase sigma-70 factor, ECF subfamily